MLPISMAGGVLFHNFIDRIAVLAPYLIFAMLFITFCRVSPREFRVTRFQWCLLAVLTGMLGGSVPALITYSLLSNVSVALLAPVLFSMMDSGADIPFMSSVGMICAKVVPLIVAPLLLALLLRKTAPRLHHRIGDRQSLSFYIWAVSLFIVVGRAVSFVMQEPPSAVPEMIVIALCSGAVCCLQFFIGRRLGARYGDRIAGAQGLGQKNTVLAVWMALTYLHPVASVGPAAYVAWQNTINSAQLYYKIRHEAREAR